MSSKFIIGIRREDKNKWERRVPLVPEDIKNLINNHNIEVLVQKSDIRAFRDEEFVQVGAKIVEDLSQARVIFAVKEIPLELLERNKTYIFFSHTIKGQSHNMPMLSKIMELGSNLIDYEKLVDENGRRLVFFGRYAGYAGMIDTLWALGRRLCYEGKKRNPFASIKRAFEYNELADANKSLKEIGEKIKSEGMIDCDLPLIMGFAGYGNVSMGAQEILDNFPVKEIRPEELEYFYKNFDKKNSTNIYKVVFKEEHMFKTLAQGTRFDLNDYYKHPEKYISQFEKYIPYLTVIVNGIYWDKPYPKLVTKKYLKKLFFKNSSPKLKVIGDISCDVGGAIECNVKVMDIGNPVFTYNPLTNSLSDGVDEKGVVVLSVDNLPAELPRDSSKGFSKALFPFVSEIANADMSVEFETSKLSDVIKRAMIVYRGKLTPNFDYLSKFLKIKNRRII